mgnify:CR=1 FL=1
MRYSNHAHALTMLKSIPVLRLQHRLMDGIAEVAQLVSQDAHASGGSVGLHVLQNNDGGIDFGDHRKEGHNKVTDLRVSLSMPRPNLGATSNAGARTWQPSKQGLNFG